MDIDWSEYKRSQSYRIKVDNYLGGKKAELALPRTQGPKMATDAQIRLACARDINVKGLTFTEATQAINARAKEMAANEAECLRVFGLV
jgi:hypothetical protein